MRPVFGRILFDDEDVNGRESSDDADGVGDIAELLFWWQNELVTVDCPCKALIHRLCC